MNDFNLRKKKVSIIIPSWFERNQHGKYGNDECFNVATKCLERLINATPKDLYELIIVDNGSTLGCLSCKYFKHADILIRNKNNLGFAPAVNQGISLARGEFIVQMNNDILVWEGWLETLLKDFEDNEKSFDPNIGLLMPAIVKQKIDFWDAIKLGKEDIDMKTNAGKFSQKAEFGSVYLGRKKTFMAIAKNRDGYQSLDENFKCGFGEDRWLYREVRMLGLETWRTHNLRVLHVGNLTMSKIKDRKYYTLPNREYLENLKKKHNVE